MTPIEELIKRVKAAIVERNKLDERTCAEALEDLADAAPVLAAALEMAVRTLEALLDCLPVPPGVLEALCDINRLCKEKANG